jgi:hypothetical protein
VQPELEWGVCERDFSRITAVRMYSRTISLPDHPSPRRNAPSGPSGARTDGCTHELNVLEAARGSCRRGLATSPNLDEILVCRSWPTLETCSFEEKDGSERCRKRLRVRGEARACGGELHPTQRPPFGRASPCARPPCSMPVADSQPTYGSQCFRRATGGLPAGCHRVPARSLRAQPASGHQGQ